MLYFFKEKDWFEFFSPPNGCLQYHTGIDGRFKTFNFDGDTVQHLRNQDYRICIRQEEGMKIEQYYNNFIFNIWSFKLRLFFSGYCCIIYMQCSSTSFRINPGSPGGSATWATSNIGSNCSEDYIGIEGICFRKIMPFFHNFKVLSGEFLNKVALLDDQVHN